MYTCPVVTSHLSFSYTKTTKCEVGFEWRHVYMCISEDYCSVVMIQYSLLFILDPCCGCSPPHILSLINKVSAVQIRPLYLMSTSTPGLGLILSLCFETDGYYYNKKVANYFSSRRQKQLTTGIMCWLKSILVSMKGEKTLIFHSVSWRTSIAQSMLTLTWHSCYSLKTKMWFFDLIHLPLVWMNSKTPKSVSN